MNRFDIPDFFWTMLFIFLAIGVLQIVLVRQSDYGDGPRDADSYVLKLPKAFVWVGLTSALVFIGLIIAMTIFPNDTATWHVYLVFFFFVTLGANLFLIFSFLQGECSRKQNTI